MHLTSFKYSSTKKEQYVLKVFFDRDNITSIVFDNLSKQIVGFESVTSRSPSKFAEIEFNQVEIIATHLDFSLIPSDLYQPKDKEAFGKYTIAGDDICIWIEDKITEPRSVNIWKIDREIEQLFSREFPGNTLSHFTTNVVSKTPTQNGSSIHVQKLNKLFFVQIYDQGALQICNGYETNSKEDFLFFLFSAIKATKINPDLASVYYAGVELGKSTLEEYFSNIHFATIKIAEDLEIPNHLLGYCQLI